MFKNEKISDKQKWENKDLYFEPDSSPKAWEHYKKYYLETSSKGFIKENYNFDNLFFYNKYDKVGLTKGYHKNKKWLNYTNLPLTNSTKYNRLFALEKNTEIIRDYKVDYCEAANRFGGECDFNFNEKKVKLFEEIIGENQYALKQLNRCKDNHHRLVNFSLIQAIGNMQGFKGRNRFDRLDTFILKLHHYFSGLSEEILTSSSDSNKPELIAFLNKFKDVYEYCKEIYFIEDEKFVRKIIKQGKLPIENCEDVVRYMNLAEEFWNKKEFYFLKKEFLIIGDYFKADGETYTTNDLLVKIENDLGYDEDEGKYLIERCVKQDYIIDCGGVYTSQQKEK